MRQTGIAAAAGVLIVLNLAVFGLAAWRIWQVQHPKPQPPIALAPAPVDKDVTATSGNEAFSIVFPAGWNQVVRVIGEDRFVVVGPQQPPLSTDTHAEVTDTPSVDSDQPLVFEAAIDDDFPPPSGEAVDFLAGKGKYLLSGRKYTLVYQGNNLSHARKNGDKDYIYSFPLGGTKELRVTYRVFADDPDDNVKAVDSIVRSIHKLK